LAEILLAVEFAAFQSLAQRLVGRMYQEPLAQGDDGFFHAAAQALQGARALLLGDLGPALQPLRFGLVAFQPRLVAHQPQHGEIGIDFAAEHRFQVEFQVSLAGQAGVVAQHPQAQAIGDQAPVTGIVPVEQLLHQRVRAGFGSPADSCLAFLDIHPAAHQVDGRRQLRRSPGVRDCVALALDLNGFGRLQPPVAQLLKQRQQPAFARQRSARVALFQPSPAGLESRPGPLQVVPRTVDGLIDLLAGEVIVFGSQAVQALVAGQNALQEIHRQQGAFGVDGEKRRTVECLHIGSGQNLFDKRSFHAIL